MIKYLPKLKNHSPNSSKPLAQITKALAQITKTLA